MKKTFLMLFAATALAACDADEGESLDRAGEDAPPALDEHVSQVFEKLDADGNGALTQAEVEGHRLGHKFDRADADGNGEVTPDELTEFIQAMHDKHGDRHQCDGECEHGECEHGEGHHGEGHHGKGHGGKRGHFKGDPQAHAKHVIEKLDADGDGAISADEAKEHPRMGDHFAEIDGDGDGKLTQAELVTFKKAHHGERGHRKGPPEDHAKRVIEHLDTDGDGKVSTAEAGEKPHLAERFADIDGDGDGQLTEQELVEHHRQKRERHH
jgi:hypothetical protein